MRRSVEVPEYEVREQVRVDPARTALLVIDMQNDFVSPAVRCSCQTPSQPSRASGA